VHRLEDARIGELWRNLRGEQVTFGREVREVKREKVLNRGRELRAVGLDPSGDLSALVITELRCRAPRAFAT